MDDRFECFYIAGNGDDLDGLRDIYGFRGVGLQDSDPNLYGIYRVPDAEAPYPQDYVIDKQGKVRHWEMEFDAQKCIDVIEDLLEVQPPTSVEVVPDVTAIPAGSPLGYTVTLRNNTNLPQDFVALVVAIEPGSARIPLRGPLPVHLEAGGSVTAHLFEFFPGSSPLGSWSLKIRIGATEHEIWDVDGFGFQVD